MGQDDNRALEDDRALEVGPALEGGCALEDGSALEKSHEVHADEAIHNSIALDSDAQHDYSLNENHAFEYNLADIIDVAIENEPDIESGYASGRQPLTKPGFILILASIFKSTSVHIVFVLFIIYFSNFSDSNIQPNSEPTSPPIRATLYFPPKPQAVAQATTEEPKQQPAESFSKEEIPETVIEEAISEKIVNEESATKITNPAEQFPESIEQAQTVPPLEALETNSLHSQPSASSPTPSSVPSSSSSRMERRNQALSSHLNKLQETQLHQMSQNAARNKDQIFYEQQTQGLKYDPQRFNSNVGGGLNNSNLEYMEQMHLTGIEMSAAHQSQLKPTTVDCDSAAGKVAKTMSIFLGGRVSCNKTPEFQKYIDARLNKNQK